ncbi:MAG: cytochrome c [Hymenobacteraceae bacterium]|nr:cytochrome c [Hymenobacteraceae bacterium]
MIYATKLGLACALLSATALTGCHDANDPGTEYAPQMYDSTPLEPLRQVEGAKNAFNPMGIHERVPPQGAIPRGKLAFFTHIAPDDVVKAENTLVNPYPATAANVEQGKVLYQQYCQHCHGEEGNGQGPVGIKFKGVPNYAAGAYKTMNAGHIYHVIQYGKNRMMPHGSQVNPEERWKIALFVHTLQNPAGSEPTDGTATGSGAAADSAKLGSAPAPATAGAGTNPAPASAPSVNKAPATPAAPAAEADTRTPAQRATDKIRQTHVY